MLGREWGGASWTVLQQKKPTLLSWSVTQHLGSQMKKKKKKKKLFASWHAGSAEGPADFVKPPSLAQRQAAVSNLGLTRSANLQTSQEWGKSTSY